MEQKFFEKLWLFCRPFAGRFIALWVLTAATTACAMVLPYSIGRIIDAANIKDFRAAYLWAALGIFSLLLARALLQYLGDSIAIKLLDYDIEREFRRRGLEKMNELSVGQHQNQNSGLKQDVIISGCDSLAQMSDLLIYNVSFMVLQAGIGLLVLFISQAVIAGITASSIGLYIAVSVWFNRRYGKELDATVKKNNSSQKKYTDYIRNISLLLLNSNEQAGMENYDRVRMDYEKDGKAFWLRYIGFYNLAGAVVILNTGLVLFYCLHLYSGEQISLGDISIYLFWSNMSTGFLANFNNVFRNLIRCLSKVKKLFRFLDIEPDIRPPIKEVELKDFLGQVEFRDVSFEYPEWQYFKDFEDEEKEEDDCGEEESQTPKDRKSGPVLDKISFRINPREKVAFVGSSGAGKSTIISLLMRAYAPQYGRIEFDDINVERLDPRKFRRQIGLVEQDIQLMDDTIRENLLVGLNGYKDSVSDEELWQSLETARLGDLKQRLKKGLDTNIGERGIKLSGGEKQRLAIARALLKKAPLIIFDEATSNLDSVNEHMIHEAMAEASKNATCIFIAHRLATVMNADKIFVMNEGRIIAEGKHKELLLNCETYRKLVEKQVVAF